MANDIDIYWSGVGDPTPYSTGGPAERTARLQVCPSCDRTFSLTNPTASSGAVGTLAHKPDCWFLWLWDVNVANGTLDPTGSSGGSGGGGGGDAAPTFDSTSITFDSTLETFDAATVA